jgi:chromosome segregation ATPase
MTDIVEQLRRGEEESVDGWWSVMRDAADEIERLRLELNEQISSAVQLREFIRQYSEETVRLRSQIESAEEAFVRLNDDMGRLKGAFRVNMLRAFPHMSHEEIDAHFVK